MTFDLIGRLIVAVLVLWFGYGTVLLLFFSQTRIPADCPWRFRLMGAALFVTLAAWVLIRHGKVMKGFAMVEVPDGDHCPCPECTERRAHNG